MGITLLIAQWYCGNIKVRPSILPIFYVFDLKHMTKFEEVHLQITPKRGCMITLYWEEEIYVGISLNWGCVNDHSNLTIPVYCRYMPNHHWNIPTTKSIVATRCDLTM